MPLPPPDNKEVTYTAKKMIELHGDLAEAEIDERVLRFLEIGSDEQAGFWLAVAKAVNNVRLIKLLSKQL